MNTVEKVLDSNFILGESPIWDERIKKLYFVDILDCKMYVYDDESEKVEKHEFNEYISCLALTNEVDKILIALESGLYLYDINTFEKNFLVQPELKDNYRYNDGCVDKKGRWIIGSMNNINNGDDATLQPDASLYLVNKNESKVLLDNVTISNGIVFKENYMYYIDSVLNNIRLFEYSDNSMKLVKEVYKILDGTTIDGMTMGKSGYLYIANWGGGKVLILDPESGKIVDELHLPCKNVSSCTFGGENMNELFITTSSIGDKDNKDAGCFYKIILEDQGIYENKFKL